MRSYLRRTASIILASALLFSCLPASAWEKGSLFAVLEAEILGGYSEIVGRDGEFASLDRWLVSPSVKLREDLYWINLYNGTFDRQSQVVAQEEGGRRTNTTQTHNLSTGFKYLVNETWSLRPTFFANWVFVNETEDEDFGKGLYDYEELGGGIESRWLLVDEKDQEDDITFGFRYINREYPNYRSLLSLFDPNGAVETDEKDLDGYKFTLSRDHDVQDGWSWGAEAILFYKDYSDKKTIDRNGIRRPGDTREDLVETAGVHISHALSGGWHFRLDGQFSANQSNLDFYDTHNTLSFADDNFIPDYFDYFSFLAKPSLTYVQNWEGERRFVFTADYAFYALHYPGRKAQNAAGVYGPEDQEDFQHTFSGKASVPITPNISWVLFGSYTLAESNQEYEAFYLYEYDLWTATSGVSLKF